MSDLIRREDALREILAGHDDIIYIDKDAAAKRIRNIPAVRREFAHWILTSDEQYEYCTCSACGFENGENWMIGADIPFCSNCGADMRSNGEELEKTGILDIDCPWR